MRRVLIGIVLALSCLLGPVAGTKAQPLPEESVPEPLRSWIPWVLDGEATYGCTWVGQTPECVWPGELELNLDRTGGRFEQRVVTDREVLVPLPGERALFPHAVRVDGTARPVVESGDPPLPHVRVEQGSHRITGELRFQVMPELLRVPPSVARIALTVSGKRIDVPRRNEDGMLWLERRAASDAQEGHLELEVHRQVEDGAPFRVTTRVTIRASGEPREVVLGNAVLGDMVPTELSADLAVRLSPEGQLVAQVHGGSFTVDVVAHRAEPPAELAPITQADPWPARETWVWVADEALRQVEVGGAPSVDPARTNLPEAWRAHPAYLLGSDRKLVFETTRRGEPEPPPNQLRLERELWLNLAGDGYTIRDRLRGEVYRTWRLNLRDGELGHVALANQDQLITRATDPSDAEVRTGVELREGAVDLMAESRLHAVGDIPAVGWSEDVQSLSTVLRLPPGWNLLAAPGVDRAPQTWVDQWDLWGIFFVLLMALTIGKLIGPTWGAVAFLVLPLSYHEPGAPLLSWIAPVALIALIRVLPRGMVSRATHLFFWASFLALLLVSAPFAKDQLRAGLFPFTEPSRDAYSFVDSTGGMLEADIVPAAQMPEAPEEEAGAFDREDDLREKAPDQSYSARRRMLRSEDAAGESSSWLGNRQGWVDPNDVIQTGPGVPDWSFRQYQLSWSGPVSAGHRVNLILIPPWLNRIFAFLRVLLLAGLLVALVRRHHKPKAPPSADKPASAASAAATAAAALLLCAFLGTGDRAFAQALPGNEQLAELRTRLTRPPPCAPDCVLASEMSIRIRDNSITLDAVVHAAAQSAYRIPGPSDRWVPDRVTVDGVSAGGLALLDARFLFLRLEEGSHRVQMEGPIPGDVELTLAFGQPPRSLTVDAPEWEVEGLRTDGQASETIQLRRRITPVDGEEGEERQLPTWLVIHRRLEIGVRWTIRSTVERVTPIGSPVVVRIPILEGESVTESAILIEGGHVVVSLGRDDATAQWTSVLEPREIVALTAREGVRWNEEWILACSPIWRCETEGLDPVRHQTEGRWEPMFRPWPGDELSLRMSRPEAAEGRSTTIDQVTLSLTPGVRMLRADLSATIRASSGGVHVLTLPEKAELQSLTIGGETRPVQRDGRTLRLMLSPGSQEVRLLWQEPIGITTLFTAPEVKLGDEAVNARVQINVPEDRWILWASGPAWGVAILFWPYLLLVLAIAFILGRSRKTPLGFAEWALLGLGLTQIYAWAALIVVLWFFAMEHRRTRTDMNVAVFDIRQLALVGYTLVALVCLYAAVHVGLLMQPEMQIVSAGGPSSQLSWYTDRILGTLPRPFVVSLPMWTWRIVMLLWAIWLAFRLLKWAKWGWSCFSTDGLWKNPPKRPVPPGTAAAPPQARAPATPSTKEGPRGAFHSTSSEETPDSAKDPAEKSGNET